MTLRGRQLAAIGAVVATLGVAAAVIVSGNPERDIGRAVRAGDVEEVRRLLARDPRLANARVMPQGSTTGRLRTSWAGRYVVHDAVQDFDSNPAMLDALAAAGADLAVRLDGRPLLHLAAARGNLAGVTWLLGRGADINARNDCAACPERGRTALHEAQQRNDRELNELLLARGAAVDALDDRGQSALHVSAAVGRPEGAMVLCARGADPALKDHAGRTPHDVAREVDQRGEPRAYTELYGPGELAAWLRPDGPCATLRSMALASGPVAEADAVVVFRAFACSRGVSNACGG